MSMPVGVDKVILFVDDLDAAKSFWTEKIGCTVTTDAAYGQGQRWLELQPATGSTALVLSPRMPGMANPDAPAQMPSSPVMFSVEDIAATHRELADKGVKFTTPPEKQFWGGWWAVFEDHEGTRYGLNQPEESEKAE